MRRRQPNGVLISRLRSNTILFPRAPAAQRPVMHGARSLFPARHRTGVTSVPCMPNADIFDLIVVGGGGSGLAAAAEAASLGAKALLVEKGETLGGTTAWSVGAYTSSATPHQQR